MSLYLNLKSRNYWSRHLTSSCSDQETAATALCRMFPTQEILFVKDSDMKAMISQVSVGKIQSLLFHRHRNREFTGGTCSPRFCNKQRRIMYFICSYIFIFDLFREGCPSTEIVFQGALSSALFIFRKCPMASRTGAKLFTGVIKFLVRLFRTL